MNDDEAIEHEAAPEVAPVVTAPRPLWQRIGLLVLPLVLTAGAVGLHWLVNVPERIHESPNDQGAKKPRAKKDEGRDARARRGRSAQRDDARSPEQLDADWERFGAVPFDEEPTRTDWARRHQAIINRAVMVARREAFRGAPEQPQVVMADATCRTVRCRMLLRSPNAKELEMLGDVLAQLQTEGESVWRSYELEAADAPADAGEPTTDRFIQITVAFRTDETNTRDLAVPADPDGEGAQDAEGAEDGAPPEPDGA